MRFKHMNKFIRILVFFSIKSIISNNIKIFVIDMNNKSFNKIISMDSFFDSLIILVPIIPKGNKFTIIVKNTRLSHSWFTRVSNNIFNSRFNVTSFDFRSMDIKTIRRSFENMIFQRFKFMFAEVFL